VVFCWCEEGRREERGRSRDKREEEGRQEGGTRRDCLASKSCRNYLTKRKEP
jgi:hypothetical protein